MLSEILSWPADSLKLVHPYKRTLEIIDRYQWSRLFQREVSAMRKIRGACYWKRLRSGQLHFSVTFLCDLSEVMALELKSKWHKRISCITISGPSLRHRVKQLRPWDRNKLLQWAWSWSGSSQWTRGRVLWNMVRFVRWPRAGSCAGGTLTG